MLNFDAFYSMKTPQLLQVEKQIRQQCSYYINQLQYMADGASLKSWGRINTTELQMFYELVLNNQQYLIKYYNETGKLKFIRPIKFPTQSVEIHSAGRYLLCYLHGTGQEYESEIFLVNLTHCQMQVNRCNVHLDCKQKERPAITTIYHNDKLQIIIFCDEDNNIYSLRWKDNELNCRNIYRNNRKIKRIQLDREENIVLVTEERKNKVLEYNWEDEVVQNQIERNHQADYYFENDFEVRFIDENIENVEYLTIEQQKQLQESLDREYTLKIKANKADYTYVFRKDAELLFFSSKNALLIINKTNNIMVQIVNQIMNIYGIDIADKPLPNNIEQNNFLATFKTDKNQNIKLDLLVYDETKGIFKNYTYTSLQKNKKMPTLTFLKKNLQRILHMNGLIEPLHEETVRKALKQLEDQSDDFERSKELYIEDVFINPLDLAEKLIRNALQSFPEELNKVVMKIKNHIMNISSTYCINQVKRLFEYCEQIQNSVVTQLAQIYKRIQEASYRSEVKSSIQSKQQNFLRKTQVLVSNMINFLSLLFHELTLEYEMVKQRKHQHEGQHIDTIQRNMAYYKDVLQGTKSIFLVIRLLLEEDTRVIFNQKFRSLSQKKIKCQTEWETHHPSLYKMEYSLLFLHQHFKSTSDLNLKRPSFSQFFSYLLQNRRNFIEVAYFYQLITSIPAVPYLETDVSDLLQNIITHIQIIPQLDQERQSRQFSTIRHTNLLYKMGATALKLRQYSFIKYIIQLAVTYEVYPLAVSLIHSGAFNLQHLDLSDEREHIFMVKSLLLCGKFNQTYLYVLRNHSNELFQQFVKWSKINQNMLDLLQFKLENKYLQQDDRQVIKLLELPQDKQKFIQGLINNLNQPQP